MNWGEDECQCRGCKQRWIWDGRWVAVRPGQIAQRASRPVQADEDPYKAFQERYGKS